MEELRFYFDHPVKGHASLTLFQKATPVIAQQLDFDTRDSNELVISLREYPQGKGKIVLDWEYEDRYFSHTREFDEQPDENAFQTTKFARADFRADRTRPFSTSKYAAADLKR